MELLLTKLRACSRQLELENSLPCWESQSQELTARIREMNENLRKKEQEGKQPENPGFLQRLLGKTDRNKEKLSSQIREITSARMAAQWELDSLENRIAAGKQELEGLAGSRDIYEAAKTEMVFTPAQESRLMMEEISALVPAARETAGSLLESLDRAYFLLEQEPQNRDYREETAAAAKRLFDILSVLPEGIAPIGDFLQAPHNYLKDISQLDLAREQLRRVIQQLRLVMGE